MTKSANFKGYVTRNLVYTDHVKKIREKKDDHWERIYENFLLTLEKTRGDGEEEPKQQDIKFREYYMNQVKLNEEYLEKKEKNHDGKYVQPPMMKKSLKVSCHRGSSIHYPCPTNHLLRWLRIRIGCMRKLVETTMDMDVL